MRRTRFVLILSVILAAATALRFYRLDHFSYWLDEILEVHFSQGTWQEFWKGRRVDVLHPPLDYLVIRGLEPFHPPDWVRKVPAALWGLGTIFVFGGFIARRAGRRPALLAMALLAFAPFHVRYSQELRPYSLGLLLLCTSMLCLELVLERPTPLRAAAFLLACLACAYTLYFAAVVLSIAGAAMLAEDCFSISAERRRNARRVLSRSPLFLLGFLLAYLPWLIVMTGASKRVPVAPALALSLDRFERTLSFFTFASNGGVPPGAGGLAYAALMAAGAVMALRRPGLRFLVCWAVLGAAAIEIFHLLRPLPYEASRHFLPAGLALIALAALAMSTLFDDRRWRLPGAVLLTVVMLLDARELVSYYRAGRPDWRPLGEFLGRETKMSERVLSENSAAQICADFYFRSSAPAVQRPRILVAPDVLSVESLWPPASRAWLILGGGPVNSALHRWADRYPSFPFPAADGSAEVRRLDAALRTADGTDSSQ